MSHISTVSQCILMEYILIFRHFSKSKGRRDVEPPWSTGVQAPAQTQPPSGHPLNPAARTSRALVRDTHRERTRADHREAKKQGLK